jgi:predicted glycosyltransferase involved in capsule biosynthesis
VRVEHAPIWSRSRCLNIGIRCATTKFLLASDADVILSPRYISHAIAALKASPFSVIGSPMLDLPETSTEFFMRASETGDDLRVEKWRKRCSPRLGWELHPSVVITYTPFFRLIRGYDEYYELWGAEDVDLIRRFTYLGLQPRRHDGESYYLHQWHVKFEGIQDKEHTRQVQRNHAYLAKNHSILRNDGNWGTP